jgi:hypothetical protein
MEYTSARVFKNLRGEVEKARSEERTKSSLYERAKGAPEAPEKSVMDDL